MTTTTKPLYNEHRILRAEEVLALTIFDEHKGLEPLKLSSCELRMKPVPFDESFLMESGYLSPGTGTGGRPIKGTARITVEGQQAIRNHLAASLHQLDRRIKDTEVERQKEIYADLGARLREVKPRYEDAEELQAPTPSAGSPKPVKRRDAKGKLIPRAKRGAAAEETETPKASAPSTAAKGKGKAAPAAPPRRRR